MRAQKQQKCPFFPPYCSPVKASRSFFSPCRHSETSGPEPCWCSLCGSLESLSLREGGAESSSPAWGLTSRDWTVFHANALLQPPMFLSSALSYMATPPHRGNWQWWMQLSPPPETRGRTIKSSALSSVLVKPSPAPPFSCSYVLPFWTEMCQWPVTFRPRRVHSSETQKPHSEEAPASVCVCQEPSIVLLNQRWETAPLSKHRQHSLKQSMGGFSCTSNSSVSV